MKTQLLKKINLKNQTKGKMFVWWKIFSNIDLSDVKIYLSEKILWKYVLWHLNYYLNNHTKHVQNGKWIYGNGRSRLEWTVKDAALKCPATPTPRRLILVSNTKFCQSIIFKNKRMSVNDVNVIKCFDNLIVLSLYDSLHTRHDLMMTWNLRHKQVLP